MATDVTTKLLTAEEFMAADLGEGRFELVRGEVVQLPSFSHYHINRCIKMDEVLSDYGRRSGVGFAVSRDSPVITRRQPDTVRGADLCFYREDRWPRSEVRSKIPPVQPDLAVEVCSPADRRDGTLRSVAEYLATGIAAVWVVYPKKNAVAIYRSPDEPPEVFEHDAVIENVPELPGFRCPVADFFL